MIWFGCDAIQEIVFYPHHREVQMARRQIWAICLEGACEDGAVEIGKEVVAEVDGLSWTTAIYSVDAVDLANHGVVEIE